MIFHFEIFHMKIRLLGNIVRMILLPHDVDFQKIFIQDL